MCDYRVTDNIQHTQLGILHQHPCMQACKTVNLGTGWLRLYNSYDPQTEQHEPEG